MANRKGYPQKKPSNSKSPTYWNC